MNELFSASDFKTGQLSYVPSWSQAAPEMIASIANQKFSDYINTHPRVGIEQYWAPVPGEIKYRFPTPGVHCTHYARLIDIQEIECSHKRTKIWEPHLAGARKCLDCEKVYNPNREPNWKIECKHEPLQIIASFDGAGFCSTTSSCAKCGISLIADWKPA